MSDDVKNSIGFRIKQAVGLTGYNNSEFCEKVNRSRVTLTLWTTGKNTNIRQSSLDELCNDLSTLGVKCSSEWLLDGIGQSPEIISKNTLQEKVNKFSEENVNTQEITYKNSIVTFIPIDIEDIKTGTYQNFVILTKSMTVIVCTIDQISIDNDLILYRDYTIVPKILKISLVKKIGIIECMIDKKN